MFTWNRSARPRTRALLTTLLLAALAVAAGTGTARAAAEKTPASVDAAGAPEITAETPASVEAAGAPDLTKVAGEEGTEIAAEPGPEKVAGEPDDARWGEWACDNPNSVSLTTSYQRVDGARFGLVYRHEDPRHSLPRFRAETGYATSRKRWLYSLSFEQPLFARDRVRVGGGVYRLTRSFEFDDEIVGASENTLAALLFKQDYREYFEGDGGFVSTEIDVTDKYMLAGRYRAEENRSLAPEANWSVFDGSRFRPNPAADEGTLRSFTVTASHDSRPKDPDDGVPFIHELRRVNRDWVRLSYETSGRSLGGDFDYGVTRLDARGYWKLTPEQFLSARVLAGKEVHGRLPVQKEFYAGGISTLRAHPYKAFRGDRLLLLNVEYAVDLFRSFQGLVFTDAGRAWYHADAPNGPKLPVDVGMGMQTRDERLRIFFGKDAREASSPLFVTLRTQASF